MQSGILAMTWGRTGDALTAVAFCPDGTGRVWNDFTPLPVDNGGYNDMVEARPGVLLASGAKRRGKDYDLCVVPITVGPIGK